MRSDRPTAILVEQAPRELPASLHGHLTGAPPVCCKGAFFVDEMFRERRISSVEWEVLREAIWPLHPGTGSPLFASKREAA